MKNKRRPLSLTLRVLVFVSIAVGLGFLLIAGLILRSIEHHFAQQDAGELKAIVHVIHDVLAQRGSDGDFLSKELPALVAGHHGTRFEIRDMNGLLLNGRDSDQPLAGEAVKSVEDIRPETLTVWQRDGQTLRGVVTDVQTASGSYQVTAAINMEFHLQFLQGFRDSLWFIMLASGILTLVAAAFAVYQGHLPLRGLSRSMREIQADRLDTRIDPQSLPAELRELAASFNTMLGRLQQGFEQLSHFSSDIAHELRTPLTSLMTQIQVTISKPRDTSAYREALYSALEELERLSKMVADMLWLAKSDNQQIKPESERLNLRDEIQQLLDFFEALAAEKLVSLQLEGDAPPIFGDRSLLLRAVSNLLSNALRYTPDGRYVKVTLEQQESNVLIHVANPGDTIPPQHLDKLFDRFYRVDPSRQRHSEGAGLGLAIARSVVNAHGGDIRVSSADGMTCFTVRLPR
ncbi:MAG: two-component sensor histidine kinase [Oceanospirillaceae bacterium]|nr:two-component sensor histidine kinase [Oceanospirillaceae bacterium]MBT12224.1 two-component sensor histidine kinase [Oceanospirillaceae bacterium]